MACLKSNAGRIADCRDSMYPVVVDILLKTCAGRVNEANNKIIFFKKSWQLLLFYLRIRMSASLNKKVISRRCHTVFTACTQGRNNKNS